MAASVPVLPFDRRRGWQQAGELQRLLVALFPVLLVFWVALPHLTSYDTAGVNDVSAVLGGFVFYAVARVLRPHPAFSVERLLRHGLASLSMACATNFFLVLWTAGDSSTPTTLAPLVIATLGLLVTAPWGLVACLVRSCRAYDQVTVPDYAQRVAAGRQPLM